jgi:hypothetical protein
LPVAFRNAAQFEDDSTGFCHAAEYAPLARLASP